MRYRFLIPCALSVLAACGAQETNREQVRESSDSMPGMQMASEDASEMEDGVMEGRSAVHLTPEEERLLGVVYLTVETDRITRTVRTVGQVSAPETHLADVTLKYNGFVERLHVDFTGETVRRGEPLFDVYAPELVAAQEELLTASRLVQQLEGSNDQVRASATRTLESARNRLRNWDVTEDQVREVEETGVVNRVVTVMSPATGIVLEKLVTEGQRVAAGDKLYRIADLSTIWVEGEVFEQDLQFVRQGAEAHIEISAYPGQHIMGRVSFVHPTVNRRTRTNAVRVTVANPDGRLKPGMFATVFFDAVLADEYPVIPLSAVVVTGQRNIVFARDSSGMLVPRSVVLGARDGGRAQILQGLEPGEIIAGSASFLIDAESRLSGGGGMSGMPGMQHAGHAASVEPAAEAPPTEEHDHD